MGQPYGKTGLPSDWRRNFLHSITSFNIGRLRISAGIRAGVLIIVLLAIGLVTNHIRESVLAILGTINVCLIEIQTPKWPIMVRTLILVSITNAILFTIGSLIGTTDSHLGIPLFAFGLFILSYMGVYSKTASIVIVSSVIFSVGVSLPGINVMPSGERFLLFLLGGLWGTLGAAIIPIILTIKKSSSTIITEAAATPTTARNLPSAQYSSSFFLHTISQVLHPLVSNMSLRSGHFQFAIAFAITGAIGLLIAQGLGLIRGYWVLITICVLLLRSDISVTFSSHLCE